VGWFVPTFFFEPVPGLVDRPEAGAGVGKDEILAKIEPLARRILASDGIELVEVDLGRGPRGWLLRLVIDKRDGVSLDDCERTSRQMGAELDAEDLIPTSYTLEVSSPGLDRPLRTDEDFRRFTGRLIALSTSEPIRGQRHIVGRLTAFGEGIARIVDERGAEYEIPREKIAKARLEVEF
jgi:ribosome maturation factor RimP